MADYALPQSNPPVLAEPTTNRDGANVGVTSFTQIILLGRNPSDGRVDTFDPILLATDAKMDAIRALLGNESGTYGYAAGTSAGNVDVPTGARIKRVSVLAGASTTTITILGGNPITIPAGQSFDEQIPGSALGTSGGADVVISGTPQSYYVSWCT